MKKNLNKLLVPIIYSNKLLLHQVKTQLLKVINYYCLQGMLWISRKFFLFFLNTIAGASTQSQAQAEAQAADVSWPGIQAQIVIIYDESKPGDKLTR